MDTTLFLSTTVDRFVTWLVDSTKPVETASGGLDFPSFQAEEGQINLQPGW